MGRPGEPGLRFDRVALRFLKTMQMSLREAVPRGATVLLTITAPIRLPSKTAAVLEEKIQAVVNRGSTARDRRYTIHGNRVRIRFLRHGRARAPKFMGFVHNPDRDANRILNWAAEKIRIDDDARPTNSDRRE